MRFNVRTAGNKILLSSISGSCIRYRNAGRGPDRNDRMSKCFRAHGAEAQCSAFRNPQQVTGYFHRAPHQGAQSLSPPKLRP